MKNIKGTCILEFKSIKLSGVKTLIRWAFKEGWNPGINDAKIFYNTDNQGFFGLFFNKKMIGGGSIVSYNRNYGFMGLFIIIPEYRSKGYGNHLWLLRRNYLILRNKKNAPIGMDGVVNMQPYYQKGGFFLAHKDVRYVSIGRKIDYNPFVQKIVKKDFKDVLVYDTFCFGYERKIFLEQWLFQRKGYSFKYSVNGVIKGFIVVRKAMTGYKIGPLFADDYAIAKELFKAALTVTENNEVFIDIPTIHKKALSLVRYFKATPVFECGRMYYGKNPNLPMDKIFGITSLELG